MVLFCSRSEGVDDDETDLMRDDVMYRCPDEFDGEICRLYPSIVSFTTFIMKSKICRVSILILLLLLITFSPLHALFTLTLPSEQAMITAIQKAEVDTVKCLIKKDPHIINALTTHSKHTMIGYAADKGLYDIVKVFIDAGASVNGQNSNGYTPLMNAVSEGHYKVVMALLLAGAKKEMKEKGGYTALMLAGYHGYLDSVKALVEKGAKINVKNKVGETALMKAVEENRVDVVKFLLKKGAKIDATNRNGDTALDIANIKNYTDLKAILVEADKKQRPKQSEEGKQESEASAGDL